MKLTLITIGLMCIAFISGFALHSWVNRELLESLQRELRQCQDGRARLGEVIDGLTKEIAALRRTLGMNHRA